VLIEKLVGAMSRREKFCKNLVRRAIDEATKQLGYAELRPNQALMVNSFLEGRDVFVTVPTGSGKSLCYCLLPKVFDILRGSNLVETQCVVIVVSPLVVLMKDQVRQMTERNMRAVYVGDVDSETENEVCSGKYQLVYLSPEALLTNMMWRDNLQSPVYQQNLVALVID